MTKQWIVQPQASEEELSPYGNSRVVAQLLFNRGIKPHEASKFLNPEYSQLHSPYLFRDMQKAVDRIWLAIETSEKIYIYGDYDADAVTANAVLHQALRPLGADIESYIPDRFTEGYGLNLEAFQKIKDHGTKVVITVDCGTNSVDVADFCMQNGIDLIITDHHEIIGEVPNAFALINPKNPEDTYPYDQITGVGVAFKLATAVLDPVRIKDKGLTVPLGYEKWLLDLVAIGTVADCHSLLGENRILVKYGLQVLAKTKWTGLKALCAAAKIDCTKKFPDTYTLGFIIAPRLNAAGRLEHANIALHLLLEENKERAMEQAVALEKINIRRQEITKRVVSEAKAQGELIRDRKIIVVMHEDWPKGIVGLVAGRLVEEFNRPIIVLEKGLEESTGSARTVGNFNVVESLKHAGEHLVRFGGHKQAAGLTLRTENFENFYIKLLEYAEQNLREEDTKPYVRLETFLLPADFTQKTYEELAHLEPFGVDNVRPKFLIEKLELVGMKAVGNEGQHMQFSFQSGAMKIAGIGFNLGYYGAIVALGDILTVAAELTEEEWNGRKTLKLRVIDVMKQAAITI